MEKFKVLDSDTTISVSVVKPDEATIKTREVAKSLHEAGNYHEKLLRLTDEIDEAILRFPDEGFLYDSLAECYQRLGNDILYVDSLQKAVQCEVDVDLQFSYLISLADFFYDLGDAYMPKQYALQALPIALEFSLDVPENMYQAFALLCGHAMKDDPSLIKELLPKLEQIQAKQDWPGFATHVAYYLNDIEERQLALNMIEREDVDYQISSAYVSIYEKICRQWKRPEIFYLKEEQVVRIFNSQSAKTMANTHRIMNLMPNSPKVSIHGLTVDLKYNAKTDSLKILEVNMLPSSGLTGYDRLHDVSMREVIGYDYSELSAYLAKRYPGWNRKQDPVTNEFLGYNGYEKIDGIFDRALKQSIVSSYASVNVWLMAYFKDYFADAMRGKLSDYIPETVVASKYDSVDMTMATVRTDITSSHCVVKPCDDATGSGVIVCAKSDISDICNAILTDAAHPLISEENRETWRYNVHPIFIIQSCERSMPCKAEDNKYYDGTMRAVLTHYRCDESGIFNVVHHGQYWKLPQTPYNGRVDSDGIISQAPSKIKTSDTPKSAIVDRAIKDQVEPILTTVFQNLAGQMAYVNNSMLRHRLEVGARAVSTQNQDGSYNFLPYALTSSAILTDAKWNPLIYGLARHDPDMRNDFYYDLHPDQAFERHLNDLLKQHRARQPLATRDRRVLATRTDRLVSSLK